MRLFLFTLLFVFPVTGAAKAEGARDRAEIIVPERMQRTYDAWHFAPAVKIDGRIYLSGVVATPKGGDLKAGYRRAWRQIEEVLQASGATLEDIVEMTSFHTALQDQLQDFMDVNDEFVRAPYPAWTAIGITELAVPQGVTEIRVIAHAPHLTPLGQ